MKSLKIAAGLLLLVQAFHLALLQDSTDSPGRTIPQSWLRDQKQNALVTKEENDYDQGFSSGTPMDDTTMGPEEEKNVDRTDRDMSNNQSKNSIGQQSEFENNTIVEQEFSDANISDVSQTNTTQLEEVLNATANVENATRAGDFSNSTEIQSTTSAPENNTTAPDVNKGLTNSTETNNTTVQPTAAPNRENGTGTNFTTAPDLNDGIKNSTETNNTTIQSVAPNPEDGAGTNITTAATTAGQETSTLSPFTTVQNPESSSTAALNTLEKTNRTGTLVGGSEKGLETDPYRSRRSVAWVAVLGTVAVVAVVGFVAYSVMKKRQQKAFAHRKLVEEFPSEPVLRLDNGEPLDLRYGGSGYYNPGLQGDDIQMTNIPSRR
ncbi:Mucin-15 [Oryzias melastigma]|uniref:Mucin-15 n=1 Tax=Oryzias melastigma TaxID=30732 RepID=A0A834BZG3_ORYME|nr:Mucin-15 [Oryzias melastigma]